MAEEIKQNLPELDPKGRYAVRVRSIDGLGNKSDWAEVLEFNTGDSRDTVPKPPSDVTYTWNTSRCVISWSPTLYNVDNTAAEISHYELVTMVPPPGGGDLVVVHARTIVGLSYGYIAQDIDSDWGGGPYRSSFDIMLRAVSVSGEASAVTQLTATHTKPVMPPTPEIAVVGSTFVISMAAGLDYFKSGTMYVSNNGGSTFSPMSVSPTKQVTYIPGHTNPVHFRYKFKDMYDFESDFSPIGSSTAISSNFQTPGPHAASHKLGGTDALSVSALQLTEGTVPLARLGTGTRTPVTVLHGDNTWKALASEIHAASHKLGGTDELELDAKQLTGGTVPLARLGTGTPTVDKILYGDNEWKIPGSDAADAAAQEAAAAFAAAIRAQQTADGADLAAGNAQSTANQAALDAAAAELAAQAAENVGNQAALDAAAADVAAYNAQATANRADLAAAAAAVDAASAQGTGDQAELDAAAATLAASNAQITADQAELDAAAASVAAGTAQNKANKAETDANTALLAANGKNTIYRGGTTPTVPTEGHKTGDTWFDGSSGSTVIKSWSGSAWATQSVGTAGLDQAVNDQITDAALDAIAAQNAADQAAQDADDAANAAATADGKAVTAISDALAANNAAIAAAGIANGKGKVLVQSTAPGADDRNENTLWIDTTGGANTPKRWTSGTTWVAVTDKTAVDAAAAAAVADGKAVTAQNAAATADGKAVTAANAAGTAQTKANKAELDAAAAALAASNAQDTANQAELDAAAADLAASNAQLTANQAESDANAAALAAGTAQTKANQAELDAAAADLAASNAQLTANQAELDAAAAQSTGDQAELDAAAASVAAGNAQVKANKAETDAATAQSKANKAETDANTALLTANGKNTIYRGTTPAIPTGGHKVGDTWFDTGSGSTVIKSWSGTAWVVQPVGSAGLDQSVKNQITGAQSTGDAAVLAASVAQTKANKAETDANTALLAANGKNTIYRGNNTPTVPIGGHNVGDTWFDTSSGSTAIKSWSGFAWATQSVGSDGLDQAVKDQITDAAFDAASAQDAADQAAQDADDAANAAATADGKAVTAISDALAANNAAIAAAGIANGKGKVLVQSSAPGSDDRNANTLWIDTTDGANTPKRWTGGTTWVAVTDKTAIDAANAAATADGKAVAAQNAAAVADGKAVTAQNAAATADGKAVTAANAAATADAKAVTADGKAVAAKNAADQAAQDADDAASAAATADGKAVDAISDALAANNAAIAAAGIANGKGKVLVQSTAPGADDRNENTLWIDTTGGANTPKRWTGGSTWVAVTDKTAVDAATAAAVADGKAVTAQNAAAVADGKAVAAQNAAATADGKAVDAANAAATADGKAVTAQSAANTAQTKANNAASAAATADGKAVDAANAAATAAGIAKGKGKVLVQNAAPGSDDRNTNTLWIDTTGGANTPKRWTSGTTWVAVTDKTATDAASVAATAVSAAATAQTKANDAASAAATADGKAVAAGNAANAAQTKADTATTDAATADGKAVSAAAEAAKVRAEAISRGNDLVTNGTGSLKDNTNFPTMTFVGDDAPTGSSGSFQPPSTNSSTTASDRMPVDVNRMYAASIWARQSTPGVTSRFYLTITPYDADGYSITPSHYMEQTGTRTTLSEDLVAGQTVMKLTSAANWNVNPAGSTSHRTIILWNYVDGGGKLWGPGTYSRNYTRDAYAPTGITGNNITLRTAHTGDTIPAGTSVSNGSSGGTYMYPVSNQAVPQEWTYFPGSALIGGIHTETRLAASTKFPIATSTVAIGILCNRDAAGGVSAQRFAGFSFSDVTANAALVEEAALAAATADSKAVDANNAAIDAAADAATAQSAAGTAQSAANAAMTAAGTKSNVYYSTAVATGTGARVDDIWRQRDASNQVVGEWRWVGGSTGWQKITLTSGVFSNLDAGLLTAGTVNADRIGASSITAVKIAADAITANKIKAGEVTAGKLSADSVVATNIVSGAITTDKIAANAIIAIKISADAVTAAKIKAGAVVAGKLAVDSVVADNITSNAVTADKILADAVTADKILAGSVTAIKIDSDAITTEKLAVGAVTATEIATNAITATKIKAGEVIAGKLGVNSVVAANITADAVTAIKILAGSITATKIETDAVEADKIKANAVTATKILAGSIIADKIATNAVTAIKINADAVTADKIKADAVEAGKIKAGAITATDGVIASLNADIISTGTLNSDRLAAESITADKIATNAITADKILAGEVTAGKLSTDSVVSDNIVSNAITADKILAGEVTAGKLSVDSVVSDNIVSNAITADKILAGEVTAGKLSTDSVVSDNIVSNAIITDKIAVRQIEAIHIKASAITANEIKAETITALEIKAETILSGNIKAGEIEAKHIKSDTITADKLDALELAVGKHIVSHNYMKGLSGWAIYGDGTAELHEVIARGTIKGSTISGSTITGSLFRSAESGRRVEIQTGSDNGVKFFSGSPDETEAGHLIGETDPFDPFAATVVRSPLTYGDTVARGELRAGTFGIYGASNGTAIAKGVANRDDPDSTSAATLSAEWEDTLSIGRPAYVQASYRHSGGGRVAVYGEAQVTIDSSQGNVRAGDGAGVNEMNLLYPDLVIASRGGGQNIGTSGSVIAWDQFPRQQGDISWDATARMFTFGPGVWEVQIASAWQLGTSIAQLYWEPDLGSSETMMFIQQVNAVVFVVGDGGPSTWGVRAVHADASPRRFNGTLWVRKISA